MIQVEQHGPITSIRMARSFLGKPLYWTTAYWVDGLLIDTGPRCAAPELVRILQQVQVDQIVVTHGHEDTIGGLSTLAKQFPKATVYASQRTIPILQQPTLLRMQFYRRFTWGVPDAVNEVVSLDSISNEIVTPHHSFRVLETPGHCRDHISLFEPKNGWLFSGDAFIGGRERSSTEEFDLLTSLGSLHTLVGLRPERLFPSSGVVRRAAIVEINEKITQLQGLAAEVARLEAAGMNVEQTVVELFKEEPPIRFWTQGHYSATNLVNACRAYNALFTLSDPVPSVPLIDAEEDHSADILSQLKLDDIFANFDNNSTGSKSAGSKSSRKPPPGKESTDTEDHKR